MFFKVDKHFCCVIFSAKNATSRKPVVQMADGFFQKTTKQKLCLNPKPKFTDQSVKLINFNSNF